MSSGTYPRSVARRIARSRAISPITSLIVTIVVLALVGIVAYGIMGGFQPASKPTCQPISSPECAGFTNLNDVALIVPFQSVQQGTIVPLTVNLPAGETATSYSYNYGDGGAVNKTSSPNSAHVFRSPGIYLLSVTAMVSGVQHTNYHQLVRLTVQPSFAANANQSLPTVAGSVLGNGSIVLAGASPTGVLSPGGSITVGASYSSAPTNPLWREVTPKIVTSSGGQIVTQNATSVNASAKVLFSAPGSYTITFVGGSVPANATGATTPTTYANFTWSVFVPPSGTHAAVLGNSVPPDPHPGTIVSYELAPGGAHTEDPAIAYDTVSAEAVENVYQTLIAYNGTAASPSASSFIPVIATCVPGSAQCASLYNGNNLTAPYQNGTDYTFVVSSAPQFYDPQTGVNWGVYPSDVAFSVARTLGFSTLPCVSCNNGWILAQSLLSHGNVTWDTIHGSYNNTPQRILNSMVVNGTECPAAATTNDHGCITFHVDGEGHGWPYFLELIADPLGGSIVPCGWFSSHDQGAGIPYWSSGNSSGAGDHPCQMPGNGSYGLPANQIPATGWDQWETIGSGELGRYDGKVQYSMVGSGPYYLSQYIIGVSYSMTANPAYAPNPDCTWSTCYPPVGSYAKTIEVTWETDATQGEQALASGVADFAGVPTTDISLLLQLISEGKVNAVQAPTLSIGFQAFTLNFNLQGAQKLTTNPVTVRTDFFSYLGMRQFFVHSYPYATVQNTIETKNGIQFSFPEGGAIPAYMANYYPQNITWPTGDPCTSSTDPTCATYWWDQMHSPTSPYYDPEVAACSSTSPCILPLVGDTGNPTGDVINTLWGNEVNQLTGGAIQIPYTDIPFPQKIVYSTSSGPGQNPMPFYDLGWAPDYPDPTDYVQPLYLANSTYTYSDSVAQSLETTAFGTGCPQPFTNFAYYANTAFPQSCQGVAYKALLYALGQAQYASAGAGRVLTYNFAEKIANQLALYLYTGQSNAFIAGSAWININSANLNPMLGTGGVVPYFWYTGNGVAGSGSH
jgi:peptide/nickel transport system substrate-binding protein